MDWVQAQEARVAGELARLEAQVAQLRTSLPVRDSPAKASGWRFVGVEYTCVPDSVYPWSPEVVRALWRFAPDARPLWARYVYLTPEDGSPVVYGRHAIGRYEPTLRAPKDGLRVLMPSMPCQGLTFNAPNVLEHVFQGESKDSRPGPYVPFDHDIVAYCRDAIPAWHVKEAVEAGISKPLWLLAANKERERMELNGPLEELGRWIDKRLASVSERAMKEWALKRQYRERERRVYVGRGF